MCKVIICDLDHKDIEPEFRGKMAALQVAERSD